GPSATDIQGRLPVGNGHEAVGLRVFLAGTASADCLAAFAAFLLTPFFAEVASAALDFLLDLGAVDVSVTGTSFFVDLLAALAAESVLVDSAAFATLLAVVFAGAFAALLVVVFAGAFAALLAVVVAGACAALL